MTAAAGSATARHSRRIAVVAVHGVADPEPGASARAVADLLLRRPEAAWTEAEEVGLRIPIPGLPGATAARVEPTPTLRVDERSQRFREALERNRRRDRAAQAIDPSLEFAQGLFEGYAAPAPQTYSTPRIRLRNAGAALEVDVIELYWADLSRAGQGLFRFFGELYQLLLHLPSLGRHATDAESLRHPGDRLWAWFGAMQAWAIRVLVLWIPVLNLLMLPPAAALASTVVPADWRDLAAGTVLALAGFVLLALRGLSTGWRLGFAGALAGLITGAGLSWALTRIFEGRNVLAALAWALTSVGALFLARFYAQVRRGAYSWARLGLVLLGLGLLVLLAGGGEGRDVPRLGVQLLTTIFVVLRGVWFLFFVLASVQIGVGLWLARQGQGSARTAWIARFSLALAALSILVVTLSAWAFVARSVAPLLPKEFVDPWNFQAPWLGLPNLLPPEVTQPGQLFGDFVRVLLTAGGGGIFLGSLALLVVLLLAVAVGVAPSILQEVAPPRDETPGQRAEQHQRISNGLEFFFRSANLLSLGLVVAVAASVLAAAGRLALPDTAAWAAGGLLVTAFVARGWLGSARSLLDVLLDVDNYMREHPRGAGPRVRMFERTHAVLQHLGAAAGGPSYDAVVFVAHSQGTVIVADYLRLARHRGWQAGTALPVHLMTMGSPLRQLYERCFPALYAWVGREPLADRLEELQLASWTNLFRSGDYIGRALGFALDGEVMREGCIGIGAHTHYWDETAPAVGEALDRRLQAS
jgi:hypothetical protein